MLTKGRPRQRFSGLFLPETIGLKAGVDIHAELARITEKWGGPRSLSESPHAKAVAEAALKGRFAAEHRETISDVEWAVLRGLDKGMANIVDSFDDRDWTPEALLPFVVRVIPDGHPLADSINADQIAQVLARLLAPEKERIWSVSREFLEPRMAADRRISLREHDIVEGLMSYIAVNEQKPETLRTDKLLPHVNKVGAGGSVRAEPIAADEISAALDRLFTPFAMGHNSWGRIRTVAKKYLNQPAAEVASATAPRRRPSVEEIVARPSIER